MVSHLGNNYTFKYNLCNFFVKIANNEKIFILLDCCFSNSRYY